MKRAKKAITAALLSIAILASLATIGVAAADTTDSGTGTVNGTVAVNGTITPLTISVTHPISVAFAIDPNTGSFVAPLIDITNNTNAPINVTVSSLASTSGGTLSFTDVLPGDKNWSSLNAADTKKYIALGIGVANSGTGWDTGYSTATDYAAAKTPVLFGTLGKGAKGSLALSASFGNAFDNTYTATGNLALQFTLA